MTIGHTFLMEIKEEAKTTRKLLERVPFDNPHWKPHEKSMELGRLAAHVAEMGSWLEMTIITNELDFNTGDYKPYIPKNAEELLKFFDENQTKAEKALLNISDEDIRKPWTMRSGEQIFFTLPKMVVVRSMCMNHLVHHRAQLGIYLRMNNIPLPGSYGPTADERM